MGTPIAKDSISMDSSSQRRKRNKNLMLRNPSHESPVFPDQEKVHASQRQKKPFPWVFLVVFLATLKSLERNLTLSASSLNYREIHEGNLDAPPPQGQGQAKKIIAKQVLENLQKPRGLVQVNRVALQQAHDAEESAQTADMAEPLREPKIQGEETTMEKTQEQNDPRVIRDDTVEADEILIGKTLESDLEPKDLKCSPWEVNIDDWWQHHPTWEPSEKFTNDTHTCFTPIPDPKRVAFLKKVYDRQFTHANCRINPFNNMDPDTMAILRLQNIGFAGTMFYAQQKAFYSAVNYHNRTYRHMVPSPKFHWMYVPQDKNSWAYCPSQDLECYWLPITSCPQPVLNVTRDPAILKKHLNNKGKPKQQYQDYVGKKIKYDKEAAENETVAAQVIWSNRFMMRPRQEMRRRFREFFKTAPKLETPCTWIHVRRGDVMTEAGYDRNFYSIEQYLTKAKVPKGRNMFLLTDDAAAVEEALLLHPEYHWTYWNRTRYSGAVVYNSHFPSNDKALEVLMILAEAKLSARCNAGVFGYSNFRKLLLFSRQEHSDGSEFKDNCIDYQERRKKMDTKQFVKELQEKITAARKAAQVAPVLA